MSGRVKFSAKEVEEDFLELPSDDEPEGLSFAKLSRQQNNTNSRHGDDKDGEDEDMDSDSSNSDQEEEPIEYKTGKRKHKHAPSEKSAKKPVSWIREIPGLKKKTVYRDIRFDPAYGKADLVRARKDYAFLDEYREKELQEMKEQLRNTPNEREKQQLKRDIEVLQSRLKTLKDRDFENKVLNEHKPTNGYHLKKSEQRKLVLAEKYKTMKKKDINKAIERKRKKEAAKEKKNLPTRRV